MAKLSLPVTRACRAESVERDGKIRYTSASSVEDALEWLEQIEKRVASTHKKRLVPAAVEDCAELLRPTVPSGRPLRR